MIIAIFGKSGVGKTYVENKLVELFDRTTLNLRFFPMVTTRARRNCETDKDYIFIDDKSYTGLKLRKYILEMEIRNCGRIQSLHDQLDYYSIDNIIKEYKKYAIYKLSVEKKDEGNVQYLLYPFYKRELVTEPLNLFLLSNANMEEIVNVQNYYGKDNIFTVHVKNNDSFIYERLKARETEIDTEIKRRMKFDNDMWEKLQNKIIPNVVIDNTDNSIDNKKIQIIHDVIINKIKKDMLSVSFF